MRVATLWSVERLPGVSVVVATFNGERYILTQLRSIADQTVKPTEIIVADDGSEDRTVQVVEGFAAESDIPVHVEVNPQRLGYVENFLRAAARARSRLTAF